MYELKRLLQNNAADSKAVVGKIALRLPFYLQKCWNWWVMWPCQQITVAEGHMPWPWYWEYFCDLVWPLWEV